MSISLIVSGIGAVVAAIGIGMLMARCIRAPRGDLIAWSVALLGLFIALAAQTVGHLVGFSQVSFRAMEIGAQVIAPLALIMGIAELVATSLPGRFAARLFIPAFAFIPLVIFAVDPLSGAAFSKAWPAPTVYYQIIPNKLLEYGLAPVGLLLALIMVGIVAYRARRSGTWRAMLSAAALAGIGVIALVIPGLAPELSAQLGVTLPLSSLFAPLCLLAAALAWYAGISADRVPLTALHNGTAGAGRAGAGRAGARRAGASHAGAGRDGAYDDQEDDLDQDGWGGGRQWAAGDHTGDFESYDDGSQGVYRGGGLYRDEPAGARQAPGGHPGDDLGYGWQGNGDDYDSRELDAVYGPGGYDTGSLDAAAGGSRNDYDRNGRPLDQDPLGRDALGPDPLGPDPLGPDPLGPDPLGPDPLGPDPLGRGPRDSRGVLENGVLDRGVVDQGVRRPEATRAQLFGQIAIYTLIEDRVHEFDRLTERVVGQVRAGEPDTLVYIVHAVPSAPMQRILYEVYRDRSAYDRHQQQPYVTEFEADRRPYVLATNVIELGLQQAKVSPFPSIADLFGEPGYDTSGFERPDYTREYGNSAGQNGTAR
jgi:quinol monooxygenase YgiN